MLKHKKLCHRVTALLLGLMLSTFVMSHASAHIMAAQRGTLNVKGDGVFMVLSLPVSAFEDIDDDGDGKMSPAEFTKHRSTIYRSVISNIKLTDKKGERPLQGLMLIPTASHDTPKAPTDQIVVTGRYALANVDSSDHNELTFNVGLFGIKAEEKLIKITATRTLVSNENSQKFKFVLTPEKLKEKLFAKKS